MQREATAPVLSFMATERKGCQTFQKRPEHHQVVTEKPEGPILCLLQEVMQGQYMDLNSAHISERIIPRILKALQSRKAEGKDVQLKDLNLQTVRTLPL